MDTEQTIHLAVISTGNRSRIVVEHLIRESGQRVKVVSVYDGLPENIPAALKQWHAEDAQVYDSIEGAVTHPGVDWVMVFSPNALHKDAIVCAFEHGKHVFSEKPLATTIEDCVKICDAYKKSGKLFMVGFVLRYASLYRKAKELLDSGILGDILAINANENILAGHGGYIMRNWRKDKELSGPHLLEKCCHDFDLLNWLTGSIPTKVAAFGGLDFFRPENDYLKDEFPPETFYGVNMDGALDLTKENAFMTTKSIRDNQVSILQYRNGVKAEFQATMFNGMPERRMYISCTKGNMILELYTNTLVYSRFGEVEKHVFNFERAQHGGGDAVIMRELYEDMVQEREPKSGAMEGLTSAVAALAVDNAITEGRIIDLEDTWKKLGI